MPVKAFQVFSYYYAYAYARRVSSGRIGLRLISV